jgi:stage II sporulation protein D
MSRLAALARAADFANAAAHVRATGFAGVTAIALLIASCATVPPPGEPAQEPVPQPAPGEPEGPPPTEDVLPPAEPPRFEIRGEPSIEVGLAWDLDSLRIEPTGITGVSLQLPGDAPKPIPSGNFSAVIVRCSKGRGWAQLAPDKRRWNLEPGDTLWLARDPSEHAPVSRARWNRKTWRGTLKVFLNPRGKLTLANRLPLETYLIGVVPGEIGALSDSLIEAGRAQAVAARSYTLFYRGRRAEEGFDLYGTVEDQMYAPVEGERLLATRCVNATAGVVALSDGWPIRANYCSTCGGITAEVWEAWPADPLDYLVSRRDREGRADFCAASSHHRWREEWTAKELAANLAKYGPAFGVPLPPGGVGEILDVEVASRSRSGRVWRLEVRTSTGEIEIPAYSMRQVLRRAGNANAILRSNLFKVDVRRDRATGRTLAIVATGAGSGHGVGLCQTGALGMARAGKRGEEILRRYYAGVQLKRLY